MRPTLAQQRAAITAYLLIGYDRTYHNDGRATKRIVIKDEVSRKPGPV